MPLRRVTITEVTRRKYYQAPDLADNVSTIVFPTWVEKRSKCWSHTHRYVLRARHGARIIESRTRRGDTRKRHSSINCIDIDTTLVR